LDIRATRLTLLALRCRPPRTTVVIAAVWQKDKLPCCLGLPPGVPVPVVVTLSRFQDGAPRKAPSGCMHLTFVMNFFLNSVGACRTLSPVLCSAVSRKSGCPVSRCGAEYPYGTLFTFARLPVAGY
jgi:hypothetical protein